MPSLSTRASGVPGIGDLLVLHDERADSVVELAPARGALVTSFAVAGRELLYLDDASFRDLSKNVRGGIPVLFPSPGRLTGDAYTHEGTRYSLKQHGFARTLPFTPSATHGDVAAVTLTLRASEATRAVFPFSFALDLTVSLRGTDLTLHTRLQNLGDAPLPYALGYHPYFAVADKARARVDTCATRAFDNVTKREVAFSGFDFGGAEVDIHLLDHGGITSALHLGDGARIDVRASDAFGRWVVWTLPGQPFLCLEPWTAPFDALNSGEGLLHVPPGSAHEGFVTLAFA
ncbi:MAG: galactose mutarotase [Polyangiales bacterium]